MKILSHTDLILNPDGSIYHLHLLPEDLAETVILVGDPGRVQQISAHFQKVEVRRENREFVCHTGSYRGKRISALSTGIGTDNIDIVVNELDALVSLDLKKRIPLDKPGQLKLIRLGTSGALQEELEPGTILMASVAGGFDGVYHFYRDEQGINNKELSRAFLEHVPWHSGLPEPYFIKASPELITRFAGVADARGITLSTPGFYAPQMRELRIKPFNDKLIDAISSFRHGELKVNNFEMECSALYALSSLLGHQALTMCVAIGNRVSLQFLDDYKPRVEELIRVTLDKLSEND